MKYEYNKLVKDKIPENINKISIIGGPGTGKTTLSDNLGKKLDLPVYHIDGINYLKNWETRDEEERDKIVLDIIDNEKWIVDGTYKTTLQERVEAAELIIFLNYSTVAKLKGVLCRYLKNKGKEKKEIPGCNEQMNLKFIRWTLSWNKRKREFIEDVLKRNSNKNVIIFKNRRSLNCWYKTEFGTEIER